MKPCSTWTNGVRIMVVVGQQRHIDLLHVFSFELAPLSRCEELGYVGNGNKVTLVNKLPVLASSVEPDLSIVYMILWQWSHVSHHMAKGR